MKLYYQLKSKLNSKFFLIGIIVLLFKPYNGNAQGQSTERDLALAKKANTQFNFYEYAKALSTYLDLLKRDSTNFLYNYRTGVCYLKSNMETAKSVKYFEAARKYKAINDGATFEFHYYMGYAYHITNKFDEALESFALAKTFNNPAGNDSVVNKEVQQCEIGKKLMQIPSDIRVFNLGKNVNSIYPDYSPVVLPDQSILVFTSTKKGSTGGRKTEDGDYFEDMYISKSSPSTDNSTNINADAPVFGPAKNAGILINTAENDASITLSPDGGTLFMYRKNKVWESNIDNNKHFAKPKRFKNTVLYKNIDIAPSLYFTSDGNTLYIVSSRAGGYGGKDIYKSEVQKDGIWGPAQNLGPIINTNLDEESPFFDSDKQTLYFSSQGHNSMGGFDVFSSKLIDNKNWGQPENMGYPLNSGTDDIFYTYSKKQNMGYYTTMRKDGIGNYDVYMVRYMLPLKVSLLASYSGNLPPKDLKVTLLGYEGKDSLKIAVNQRNEVTYKANKEYMLLIPRYNNDIVSDTLHFKTPESLGGYTCLQEINYEPVKNYKDLLIGYKTTVYNVFFNMEKAIEKSGVRNTKVLLAKFPMCGAINPAYTYYGNEKLTKEEEYSKFVRTLKPDYQNFKIYSQTSYIDTSSFELIYKMQDSIAAAAATETLQADDLSSSVENKAESKPAKEEVKSTPKAEAETPAKEKNTAKKEAEPNHKHKEEPKAEEKKETAEKSEPKKVTYPAFSGENNSQVLKSIYFELAKSDFDEKFQSELKEVVDYMKKNEHTLLEIRGYTDSAGTEKYNTVLSEDRALAIKRMMVKQGINAYRIKAVGMGEEQTSAAAATQKESKKDIEAGKGSRRVDFVIIFKGKKHTKE